LETTPWGGALGLLSQTGNGIGDTQVTQDKKATNVFAEFSSRYNMITLYPKTFLAFFPDLRLSGVDSLNSDYAGGLIAAALLHELIHKCLGPAETPALEECNNGFMSCMHLAIDNAVHDILCALACELKSSYESEQDPAAKEKILQQLLAVCAEIKRLEDKWNNSGGRERLKGCLDMDPCPFNFNPNCPAALPDLPPEVDPNNPDHDPNNIVGKCACCEDFV
jgi:hypothetical protein